MFNIGYNLTIMRAHNNAHDQLYHQTVNKNDAGIDLYIPRDIFIKPKSQEKIPLGVHASVLKTTKISLDNSGGSTLLEPCGFFLFPRSSIPKTPLRMSNSIGLIDAGYRGELIAVVDNISDDNYLIKEGTRLFQIVNPSLTSFSRIEIMDNLTETERGTGGFGSTGS